MTEIIKITKELQEIKYFIESEVEKFEFKQYINTQSLLSHMVKDIKNILEYINRDIQRMIDCINMKRDKGSILNLYQELNSKEHYKVMEISQEVHKSKYSDDTKLFLCNCVAFSNLIFERLEEVFTHFESCYDRYLQNKQ